MSTPQDDRHATEASDAQVDEIVSRGPAGRFAVAGIATAIVGDLLRVLLRVLPRGAIQ